jgi:hypothetical protein
MARIPTNAPYDVQQSLREVWAAIDRVLGGDNLDFTGRRIINAGRAQGDLDYVTKVDLTAALKNLPLKTPAGVSTASTLYVGTHAARLLQVPTPDGTLWYETDRTVFYVAKGNAWLYVTGVMQAASGDVPFGDPQPPPTTPGDPTVPPTQGDVNTDITIAQPAGVPAAPNLRWFRADMCGVEVPGLPAIPGGGSTPDLVLSWFYYRYAVAADRTAIRNAFLAHGYTHFKLSYPDAKDYGITDAQYVALAQELQAAGFYVGHFFGSKDAGPNTAAGILANVAAVIPLLQAAGCIPWACAGWELSLFLTPADTQTLIDGLAALLVPGTNLYVHFQSDYIAFQAPGGVTADFWNANVNKLTGLLHQRQLSQDALLYQQRVDDGLSRCAGNFLWPNSSGFGHPFDYVVYETDAANRFSGADNQATGEAWGKTGVYSPAQSGPAGTVAVSGFGNGATPGFY